MTKPNARSLTILAAAGALLLGTAVSASANTRTEAIYGTGAGVGGQTFNAGNWGPQGVYNNGRLLDGSETATFFYRKGVKRFEDGKLDRAEEAFRAVLRADGLDRLALHYLVIINDAQGDRATAEMYAARYAEVVEE